MAPSVLTSRSNIRPLIIGRGRSEFGYAQSMAAYAGKGAARRQSIPAAPLRVGRKQECRR